MSIDDKLKVERRKDYLQIPEIINEIKIHLEDQFEKLENKLDRRIEKLERSLLDPDQGTISRVKIIENDLYDSKTGMFEQVNCLKKIVVGNGKIGLAEEVRNFKRRDMWLYGLLIIILSIFAGDVANAVGNYFASKVNKPARQVEEYQSDKK